MIVDQFDEMLAQASGEAAGDGRSHCTRTSSASRSGCATCAARSRISSSDATSVWLTTAGAIARHYAGLPG